MQDDVGHPANLLFRRDVVTLRPVLLSGYAAKSCARATHNRFDPTVPEQPSATPPELQRMFDLGNDHEAAVFEA